jgi:hypothetical protein
MTHLVKIQLQFADMFVSAIDDKTITYHKREKESGRLLGESSVTVRYEILGGKVVFDGGELTLPLLAYLLETLT